ncbi:MAG: Ig-like domain-containing protein, partial [Tardiphaga sp.]
WTLSSDNHLYKYVSDSAISWFEAKNAAQAAGGYLATITSDAENNIVFSLVGNDVAWLGGADAAVEGQWRWITEPGYASGSEPLFYNNITHWSSYAHWAGGEPNDRGDGIYFFSGEDYLATWGNKTWNDLDNSSSDLQLVDGYVIERNGTPGANYLQITEDAPTNIAKALLLANDTDSDLDPLAVSLAGGSGAGVGTSHLGATVQLSGNNFVYNPVGSQALQALGAGQTAQDYFYYQIDDGHGGTATAKVTVTVNGLNDTPDHLHFMAGSSMTAAEETNGLDDYRTLGNVAAFDPDAGDHLTYSLGSGSSSKFTLSDDGTLRTGSSDVGGGTYNLNLIATDESGASTTEKLTAWVGSSSGDTKSFASQSNDVLAFGLGGSDIITGSAHDDTLSGGGGSDTLKGGSGNDTLIGGADRDTFIFGLNDGHDTITDMKLGTASNADIIRLEGITSGQVQIVENTLTDDIRIVIGTNHIDLAGVDYNTTNVNLLSTHNLIFA